MILVTLLQAAPVFAQSTKNPAPGSGSSQLALYIPLAAAEGSTTPSTANPLTIAVTPDTALAVTQTIPAEGGVLSVTAPNGTHFTLAIPANALLSEEEIVMTPLKSASGLPLSGGLVAGVQLAPEGLRLMRPATLAIEGAPDIDPQLQAIGFGYHGNGSEFHLRPLTQGHNRFSLEVMHFSGYGIVAGTAVEIVTQAIQHAPTAPDDSTVQAAAADFDQIALLSAWFDVIEYTYFQMDHPDIDIEPDVVAKGVAIFQTWLELVHNGGLEKEFASQIDQGWQDMLMRAFYTVLHNSVICERGDASQVIKIMRLARMIQALPAEKRDTLATPKDMQSMEREVRSCATFEMDFDSTLIHEVPNVKPVGQPHDSHLRAENIRVQFGIDGKLVAPSQAPLVYQSLNLAGSIEGCPAEINLADGDFKLVDAHINLNNIWGTSPKLLFKFDPGRPQETITHHCPHGVNLVFNPDFWHIGFWRLHWAELQIPTQTFTFSSWHFVGKSLYADKIIDRPVSGGTDYYGGTTWLVLTHKPE
jgi:hypothetical protein